MRNVFETETASPTRRIAACLIDFVIITFTSVSAIFLIPGKNLMALEPRVTAMKIFPIMIAGSLIWLLKDSCHGMSPGRYIMGITVRDQNDPETVPGVSRLLLRNLLIVIWPVELTILLLRRGRSRIGDKLTSTSVIRNHSILGINRILALTLILGITGLTFAFTMQRSFSQSPDFEKALYFIETNTDLREVIGPIVTYDLLPGSDFESDGTARFRIKAAGQNGSRIVTVTMHQESDSNWVPTQINVSGEE